MQAIPASGAEGSERGYDPHGAAADGRKLACFLRLQNAASVFANVVHRR